MNKVIIKNDNICHYYISGLVAAWISHSIGIASVDGRVVQGSTARLDGSPNSSNLDIDFTITNFVQGIDAEKYDGEIELLVYDKTTSPNVHMQHETQVKEKWFEEWLCVSTFVSFWENNKIKVNRKYGLDCKKWPEIANVCRIVRNGFAHNNSFDIRSKKTSYSWKNIKLDNSMNGKKVFPDNFVFADIVLLMIELSESI